MPRYAAAAARLLAKHLPRSVRPVGKVERARGVRTIEMALRKRSRRRVVIVCGAALGVAAAVLLVTQYARWNVEQPTANDVSIRATPTGKGAELRAPGMAERLEGTSALGPGQRIETPVDGGASLRLSTGTEMVLAQRTSFFVDSRGAVQHFSIHRGELSAHVAKLQAGQRFLITTPDAEIEVRGTRFAVRVLERPDGCKASSVTRLAVSEGVVEVRSGGGAVSVRAGGVWPSVCGTAEAAPPNSARLAEPVVPGEPTVSRPSAAPTPKRGAQPSMDALPEPVKDESPLTAQNDLFAEGVALRRQGDVRGALRAYQDLITRFPKSPLAENAMVERMRLMAKSHDSRAVDEARRYLARYPSGFAVLEARQLMERQ